MIGAFILSHGVVYLDRSAPIQVRMAWRGHKGMPHLFILAPTMNEHSYTSMGIYICFFAWLDVQYKSWKGTMSPQETSRQEQQTRRD